MEEDDWVDEEVDEEDPLVAAAEEVEVVLDEEPDEDDPPAVATASRPKPKTKTVDWSSFALPQVSEPSAAGGLLRLQVIDIEHQKRSLPRWDMEDPDVRPVREAANVYLPAWKKRKGDILPSVPCIRLYCKDERGYSVCVNTYGYYPVVHLLTTVRVTDDVLRELRDYVETQLRENESKPPYPKKRPDGWQAILTAKVVDGYPAFPYCEDPCSFIEFKLSDSSYIKAFGRLMRQNGGELESSSLGFVKIMPYSCQDIVDKFQADRGVSGFGWIELAQFSKTKGNSFGDESSCHFEIDTTISWLRPVKGCDSIAPIRKMTYDIECLKTKGMPDPEKDAVIVISAVCGEYINGQPVPAGPETKGKRKVLLQLLNADPVRNIVPENGDVHECFAREADLLNAFGELVEAFDPDYICGHNMIGFDLPYLVTRADKIDADALRFMGRRRAYKWYKPRRVVKKRKNGDTRETKMTSTPGRIQLDTFNWIMNGFEKERSYKLGALAAKYLDDNKDDVGYSMIGPMFRQSDATRARLGKYCMKDSELTEALCDLKRYQMVISSIEMSRQTRIPACKLLRSGVQVKVWGLLLEKARDPHFDDKGTPVFFPDEEVRERARDDKFVGAEVLEPERGYYGPDLWIGCGDFRSLYPSIIIALNICLREGTLVRCADGLSREIERVLGGSTVQMYGQTVFSTPGICNGGVICGAPKDNGLRTDCLRVILMDGTEIVCTADHKFLVSTADASWEYIKARDLSGRRVCCSSLGCPHDDTYDNDDADYCVGPWTLRSHRTEIMAFARVLGLVLTDGSTSICHNRRLSCIFLGNEIDVQAVRRDIQQLTGMIPSAHWQERDLSDKYSGGIWRINIPSGILPKLFEAFGVPSGRRTLHARTIPDAIRNAPRTVLREFIAAYWGGDGGAPSLDQKSIVGCRLVTQMRLSTEIDTRVEVKAHSDSIKWLVDTLYTVFGVVASYAGSFLARMPDGKLLAIKETDVDTARLASIVYAVATAALSTRREGVCAFAETIGVRYCSDKQIRFEMARRWFGYRKCIEDQCRYELELLKTEIDREGRLGRFATSYNATPVLAARCAAATKTHFHGVYHDAGAANKRLATAYRRRRGLVLDTSQIELKFTGLLSLSDFCRTVGYDQHLPRQEGSSTIAVPVASVSAFEGSIRVYDLAIDGGIAASVAEHNFVAEGCVVHNCYSTEICDPIGRYRGYPFKQSPVHIKFVDKSRRIGLLPQIEAELMAARDVAKRQAKEAQDPGAANMYDKRQNEIKIICNSVYGIMTASGGRLTRMELGESVTSQGRLMIMTAKGIAEGLLTKMAHEKAGSEDFRVIYGDTDSIFILFPKWIQSKEDAFRWLKIICDAVTNHFLSLEADSPIMLQAEKAMRNGILINKKRYIFMKYEGVNDKGKILAKGVETARRDNCKMVVDCMNAMVGLIFGKCDRDGALDALHTTLRDLMSGKTDIGSLVISKAISKENYKNEPPHLAVARKMKARDPSYESGPAERIPFVVVSNGGKNVTERAEDPLWTIKQQIPLDLNYYVQNQLAGPVSRILMWIYGSAQDMHTVKKCEDHFRDVQDKLSGDFTRIAAAHKGLVKAIKAMQEHTVQRFFGTGAMAEFPRKYQSTAGRKGSIDSFFAKVSSKGKRCRHGNEPGACDECEQGSRCPECRAQLPDEEGVGCCQVCTPVCIRCERHVPRDHILDGNICVSCAEHRCPSCSAALPVTGQGASALCRECSAKSQIRKRHNLGRENTTADIEDLVGQAAEAKLKCDKCRGYTDEQEISCVQKDCLTLYRRATLEIRIKNMVVS